jgi:hypothetical protein
MTQQPVPPTPGLQTPPEVVPPETPFIEPTPRAPNEPPNEPPNAPPIAPPGQPYIDPPGPRTPGDPAEPRVPPQRPFLDMLEPPR